MKLMFASDIHGSYFYVEKLKEVILHDGLQTISDRAFEHCVQLKKINIPDTVTRIGEYAFSRSMISSITIGDGLTVPRGAFANCTSLTDIELSSNLENIANGLFENCEALAEFKILSAIFVGVSFFKGKSISLILLDL